MIRKIITINEDACNGCGLCAAACHEGAIGMVDGKARLLRDDYCDGLGDCLPACPTGLSRSRSGRLPPMTRRPSSGIKPPRRSPCPAAVPAASPSGLRIPGRRTPPPRRQWKAS